MSVLSHWKPIVAAVLLGLAAGIAYLVVAEDRYAAEAKLLVVPRPAGDATFEGFGLPRVSGGGSSAETVADLVERPSVVDPAAVQLRLDREDVLDAVTVRADDESNVVIVRAEADDPQRAAQIANAVADEFVSERSGAFQGELNRTIAQLREELRNVPASERDVPPAADARRPADRAQSLSRRTRPDGSRRRERRRERSRRLASTCAGSGRRAARLARARPGSRRAHGRCGPEAIATTSDGGSARGARAGAHGACASRHEARARPREGRGRAGRAHASRRRSRGVGREARVGARRTRAKGHRARASARPPGGRARRARA